MQVSVHSMTVDLSQHTSSLSLGRAHRLPAGYVTPRHYGYVRETWICTRQSLFSGWSSVILQQGLWSTRAYKSRIIKSINKLPLVFGQLCVYTRMARFLDLFQPLASLLQSSSSSNSSLPLQVVDIMRVNVDKVLERDQKLSDLDDRADALQAGASQFETSAAKLKRKYWWKNVKMWAILIAVIVIIIVVIIIWTQS
ncbi:unnamed protein product [Leuciscus chuanchicus]